MTQNSAENSAVWQWIGQISSGLVIFFLTMAAVMKLIPIAPVIETMNNLGFVSTLSLARGLGVFLLICTVLYTVPHKSMNPSSSGKAFADSGLPHPDELLLKAQLVNIYPPRLGIRIVPKSTDPRHRSRWC
jgi:DoxX-like family